MKRTFQSPKAYRDAVNRGECPAPKMSALDELYTAVLRNASPEARRKWQSPAGVRRAYNHVEI